MAQVEVQWNVELPVSLFGDGSAAVKIADAALLGANQPLCLRFQLQAHASCEVQLRNDDPAIEDATSGGLPPCADGYVCQVSMEGGQVLSRLHKVLEGQVLGTLESAPMPGNVLAGEGEPSFWIVVGPGAVVVGVGDMGERVVQGSFDESPIPVRSVLFHIVGEGPTAQLSSAWIGKLLVRGESSDGTPEEETLRRAFEEYKTAFQKADERARRFSLAFQPPPLRMIVNTGTQALATGRRRGERQARGAQARQKQTKPSNKRALSAMSADIVEHKMDWDLIRRLPELSAGRVDPTDLELETPGGDLHLFFLDEATGIRSKDVLRFFTDFGPRWIYWLGDRACNVFFHDPAGAQGAKELSSVEIPATVIGQIPGGEAVDSTVDQALAELRHRGWRLGRRPIRKLMEDKWGRKGARARFIVRNTLASDVREREMAAQDEDESEDGEEDRKEQEVGAGHGPDGVDHDDDEDLFLSTEVSEAEYYRAFVGSKRNRRAVSPQHAMTGQQQPAGFGGVGPQPTSTEAEAAGQQDEEVTMELGGLS